MDKESKLISTVPAFDHKHQRAQKREATDAHTAFNTPLVLPNPYLSDQTLRRNQSDVSLKPARKGGDASRSHGFSCLVRETSDDFLHRSIQDPQTKPSKSNNDSKGRIMGKTSMDAHKKGFRGARSAPNSARKSTPVQTNSDEFEVKMADFPELAGVSLNKAARPARQKEDPNPRAASPQTPNLGSSWRIEDMAAPKEEGGPGRKKRKKKKKAKSGVESAETEHPPIPQVPPKFEDEKEFPGLAVVFTGTDRLITSSNTKLCSKIFKENQREGGQQQSADLNKEKPPVGKTQPTEAAKKGQKAEKVSGKKSKVPVQLDIGNMLAALEKKQQSQKAKQDAKPVILSVGGGLPVVQKQPPAQKKLHWQPDKIAHNPLDSTSPLVKKGKQREVPKAKKPTPLKKVILKEREERKQRRLQEERGLLPEDESKLSTDATEEQYDTNATDEVGSSTEGIDDQLEVNDKHPVIGEGDEVTDKDETIQQHITHPANAPKIHSRKFRDYCSQMLRKDVDECVTTLLKELVRFQDRLYQKDPMKARMKRRIVMGLREVLKHLKLRKVKCVIISPNCERIQSKGGLDEALNTIINTCREQGVPFVFALSRKALGRCVNKAVPVSLVGIFNYDGAQDHYHKMIELSSEARRAYEVMVSSLQSDDQMGTELEENTKELQIHNLTKEPKAGRDTPEEPEYMKIWKTVLEKECNHALLNFEEQLNSMHLDSECTENTEEETS
ncbi:selenocysteine insertion sequence-binding protein 2-like isoform X3 [Melanotaenia boesemani]|uniref:selenocysteine insertion sequence-binding protein 2-like isoform X3 n=1 Tax=Melanotaenia boesemani TaxID=1250792 RepID=UPI001C050B5E|nr:selenocysteine insertion sequence-binding protein 2-like isoform X3 [Melanotaenia boesemani]